MRRDQLSVAGPVFAGGGALLVVQRERLMAERGATGVWASGVLEPLAVVFVRAGDAAPLAAALGEGALDEDELHRRVPQLAAAVELARRRLEVGAWAREGGRA